MISDIAGKVFIGKIKNKKSDGGEKCELAAKTKKKEKAVKYTRDTKAAVGTYTVFFKGGKGGNFTDAFAYEEATENRK